MILILFLKRLSCRNILGIPLKFEQKSINEISLTFSVFLDMAEGCANLHFNLGKFHSLSKKTFWYIYTQTYLGVFITIVVIQIISTLYLYQE